MFFSPLFQHQLNRPALPVASTVLQQQHQKSAHIETEHREEGEQLTNTQTVLLCSYKNQAATSNCTIAKAGGHF